MNEKVFKTLEFDKIKIMLSEKCVSDSAKNTALKLTPKASIEKIEQLQTQTEDAVSRILKKGYPAFSNPKDVREYTKRIEIGASLSIIELLHIGVLLNGIKRLKSYDSSEREDNKFDSLTESFNELDPLILLLNEIERSIISEDEIADEASNNLFDIRRKIKTTGSKIHEKMQSLLNNLRDYLQDPVITQRAGRYCLPVLASHKSKVPGMVHDQSGSGQTLFIEPMAVVELNNKLKELYLSEKEEIDRILANLSLKVYENIDALILDYKAMVYLDFVFAKGALALDMNALKPVISDNGYVNLKAARHPLLDRDKCLPIDLRLGKDFNLLIITGPNTGGKTVSLKTLGLLSLMAQSGLHIPAKDGSTLPLFYYIGADIGDEQSIEQSLSTFSSHMTNIRRILDDVGSEKRPSDHCLILLDELCAGTDPSEGAALACSILDYLKNKNAFVMATTHYSELKAYAISTDGVENASMEFDVETLSPTYKLIIGAPGKSNAFAISKKLGITDEILDDAKNRLSESDISIEEVLSELEAKRIEIEKAKEEIVSDKAEIQSLRDKIRRKEAGIEKAKQDILEKANQKASNILKDAKETADAAIRNINKYGSSNPDISKLEKNRANLGKKLKTTQEKSSTKSSKNISMKSNISKDKIRVGDKVHIISMNIDAIIQSLPNDKNEVEIQMGILRSRVNLSDLTLVDELTTPTKKSFSNKSSSYSDLSKAGTISSEIKLLGLTGDEAIEKLSKYLDDAYISGLKSVRIVHGKGAGVLRQVVSDYLRKNSVIKNYHLAEYGEGDSGVTIAEFK